MRKPQKKSSTSNTPISKRIIDGVENIAALAHDINKAVDGLRKEGKKVNTEVAKLAKRRLTLVKRAKAAAVKAKKTPSAEAKKALSAAEKEMAATLKDIVNAKMQKSAVATELAALNAARRQVNAYLAAIKTVDRTLKASKKKVKSVRKAKTPATAQPMVQTETPKQSPELKMVA